MPKENKDKQLSDKQNYRQKIIELIEKIENQKALRRIYQLAEYLYIN